MTISQIVGNYQEEIVEKSKVLMLEFSLDSLPPCQHKRARYLSVAFMTDYLVSLFPAAEDDPAAIEKQMELKSAATYITNELLENSTKFTNLEAKYPIRFGLSLVEENLVFVASNSVTTQDLGKFHNFVDELTNSDVEELYFQQLERGAAEKSNNSQLGLLSMMMDYCAKLGWKIEMVEKNPDIITITTMVHLRV
jgi:hypothetical protein